MNPAANISPAPVESEARMGREEILDKSPSSTTKHPSFPNLTAAIFVIFPSNNVASSIFSVSNNIDNSA